MSAEWRLIVIKLDPLDSVIGLAFIISKKFNPTASFFILELPRANPILIYPF